MMENLKISKINYCEKIIIVIFARSAYGKNIFGKQLIMLSSYGMPFLDQEWRRDSKF